MLVNAAGIALLKQFEGCRLKSYLDSRGIPTIGYGHTGPSVKLGQTVTQHQAEVIFESDVERFADGVADLTQKIKLTPNQFAALVCFAFNVGITRFATSTLYKKVLRGDFNSAADEFDKWTLAGGKQEPGLVRRRAAEKALFQTA